MKWYDDEMRLDRMKLDGMNQMNIYIGHSFIYIVSRIIFQK